ncbi:MAG: ABC transporter ATP-binding protein [Actinomycetota bacterium]|nr:ABC transporter ATP-binding protein [Actinomycetota bacterium]
MSEPLDLPALDEAATLLDDETPSIGALAVMKRGIKVSPELRAGLAITVVMALTAAVGRLIVPILVQLVLDNGVLSDDGYDGAYVWTVSMAALAVVLLVAAASRVALIRLVDMAETVLMNLRVRVFEHIHRLSLADHTESRRGVLVARVTSDVETLARFTQWGLISWIIDTAIIVGTIAVMLWYSWLLTLLVLVIHVPLVPFLRWVQRSQFVSYGKVRSRVAETLGHVSEAVTGAQVIRAYGYGEPVRERLDDAIERQFAQQQRSQVWFACMLPVVDVVSSISLAVAAGIGVWYRDDLGLEVGELVAFLFLVNLLLQPIAQLGEVLDQTQTALAGWWKVLRVLDVPVEVVESSEGTAPTAGPLEVELEGIGFSYRTGPPVLRDVSFTIPAESVVAVVGETGSGKTTCARLLTRLADPTEGVVRVGGVDLREVDPDARRAAIRMVPQDGFLFDVSIRDNIAYGREGTTANEVERAIDVLGLRGWIETLPDGLDTVVGERGGRLSVGERQLVALARAQVADPGLLVLDEATSAVDPETEEALAAALDRLAGGRTMISIAHRLSTAERADLVIVFDKGRVAQMGPHEELVAVPGIYQTLYESWLGNTRSEHPAG